MDTITETYQVVAVANESDGRIKLIFSDGTSTMISASTSVQLGVTGSGTLNYYDSGRIEFIPS